MPKHSVGLGAATRPGSGVGKAGEKQIELPPPPSWGKSTLYELTVLTQGEASQQVQLCLRGLGFFLPDDRVAAPEATWHLPAGGRIMTLEAKRPRF